MPVVTRKSHCPVGPRIEREISKLRRNEHRDRERDGVRIYEKEREREAERDLKRQKERERDRELGGEGEDAI